MLLGYPGSATLVKTLAATPYSSSVPLCASALTMNAKSLKSCSFKPVKDPLPSRVIGETLASP